MTTTALKTCSQCNSEKELSQFHYRTKSNSHSKVCKSCDSLRRETKRVMAELEASPYETKTCLSCKLTKFTSKDFEFQNKICKDCKKEKKNNKLREDEKSYIAYLCSKAKSRAKEKNLEYNLDPEAILSIPTHCPVFGSPIVPFSKGPNSPSIDRIDPNRGYTMDNIIIISHRANTIKNDASPEELRTIANWLECQIDMKKRHYGE